jgi:hypothetical protein
MGKIKQEPPVELTPDQIEQVKAARYPFVCLDPMEPYRASCKVVHELMKKDKREEIDLYFGENLDPSEIDEMIQFHEHDSSIRRLIDVWKACPESVKESLIEDIWWTAEDFGLPTGVSDKNWEAFDLERVTRRSLPFIPLIKMRGPKIDYDLNAKILKLIEFWVDGGGPFKIGNHSVK